MKNRYPVAPDLGLLEQAAKERFSQNMWAVGAGLILVGSLQLGFSYPRFAMPLLAGTLGAGVLALSKIETHSGRAHTYEVMARQTPATLADLRKDPTGDNLTIEERIQPVADLAGHPWERLGRYPKSALIAGVPGAGKGVFMLNALRELRARHPDVQTWILDPKNSDKELGNRRAAHVYRGCPFMNVEPSVAGEWFLKALDDFKAVKGPKLLIIDEMASVMATLKQCPKAYAQALKAYLSFVTSMGDSERVYLWLLTQDSSCEGLGITGAMRANLLAVGLVAPHNLAALGAFLAGSWLPKISRGELDRLMADSPVNRALFYGETARWVSMPKAPNLTGHDRDARKTIPTVTTPAQVVNALETKLGRTPSYTEQWFDWLEARGRTTVREAQRLAPAHLRASAEGTKAVLNHLARQGKGQFKEGVFLVPQFSE